MSRKKRLLLRDMWKKVFVIKFVLSQMYFLPGEKLYGRKRKPYLVKHKIRVSNPESPQMGCRGL
jgi:hypothetical protein